MSHNDRPDKKYGDTLTLPGGVVLQRISSSRYDCADCGCPSFVQYQAPFGEDSELTIQWDPRHGYTASASASGGSESDWKLRKLLSEGSSGYYSTLDEAMAELAENLKDQRATFQRATDVRTQQLASLGANRVQVRCVACGGVAEVGADGGPPIGFVLDVNGNLLCAGCAPEYAVQAENSKAIPSTGT